MNLCVVGVGYVGLVSGACFAEFGNAVVVVDKDETKIADLRSGRIPIYEPGLEDLVDRNVKAGRLRFAHDVAEAVRESLVVFIAVGTPQAEDGRADLTYVRDVARTIARNLTGYKVIVTKSTVPAGTGREIRTIVERERDSAHPFSVASNPEFLREGSAIEDFLRPNRVVFGTEDEMAAAILSDLYRPLYLIETPIIRTDVVTAELIKYASNAFLATKISFINEIADLCEALGADVHGVAKGMGLDRRIGGKFLHPGPGYGGSCFPKDTRAAVEIARGAGLDLRIVRAVIEVNESRVPRMLEKLRAAVGGELAGRTIGQLGLTFKPNTDDLRESPAMAVLSGILAAGARARVYDPVANAILAATPRAGVTYCADERVGARRGHGMEPVPRPGPRPAEVLPRPADDRRPAQRVRAARGAKQGLPLHGRGALAVPRVLVTGGGGFIGSNLTEALLRDGSDVRVLDDFSTGRRSNLAHAADWAAAGGASFDLVCGDIRDLATCQGALRGVDFVLHEAAIPSVQRSVQDPRATNAVNVTGTLNLLEAAREVGVQRFVFASSSSVYGESEVLPKIETMGPAPISPYGLQKLAGETYCLLYHRLYGVPTVALRYFNVFGPRQDPTSEYSAVIPRFVAAALGGTRPTIYGDGEQSRDFTFVGDVVQANQRACAAGPEALGRAYNVACGGRISLNDLLREIGRLTGREIAADHVAPRAGDIRHSLASIDAARERLGFRPAVALSEGLRRTIEAF